jgi:hypothetical protein
MDFLRRRYHLILAVALGALPALAATAAHAGEGWGG